MRKGAVMAGGGVIAGAAGGFLLAGRILFDDAGCVAGGPFRVPADGGRGCRIGAARGAGCARQCNGSAALGVKDANTIELALDGAPFGSIDVTLRGVPAAIASALWATD